MVRLVVIGKTGSGKSSTGNSILGEEKFPPIRGWNSGTKTCDWNQAIRNGVSIQITDTPGVFDTSRPQEEVSREITKVVVSLTPGPHAVLMVFKAGDRFTKEEGEAYKVLKELFGQELTKYMIVVFTGLDALKADNIELDSALEEAPSELREIMREANDRYIGFDNRASWEKRIEQGDRLLAMVSKLTEENGGTYFSKGLVIEFETEMQKNIDESKTREHVKRAVTHEDESDIIDRFLGILEPHTSALRKRLGPESQCSLM